jgi:hypothetical protein
MKPTMNTDAQGVDEAEPPPDASLGRRCADEEQDAFAVAETRLTCGAWGHRGASCQAGAPPLEGPEEPAR